MNNGKVRIYELSKELNLDNRDILAICDQLNISAKSHSSTITEQDASRIRTAAEKYTPIRAASASTTKHVAVSQSTGSRTSPSVSKPPVKKKQQILEIRRHQPVAESPNRPEVMAKPQMPQADDAPMSASPNATPPLSQSRPARRDSQSEESQSDLISPPFSAEAVEPHEAAEVLIVQEQDEQDMPTLIKPPPRPSAGRDRTLSRTSTSDQREEPASPSTVERPIIRRLKPQRSADSDIAASETGEPVESRREASRDGRSPAAPRPKPAIELRKPPSRPSEGVPKPSKGQPQDDDSMVDATDDASPLDELDLQRPVPPRPHKKQKTRREEEEEDQDVLQTQAKPAKAKRRAQPVIDDEDDDLDDLKNGEDSALTQISLSLMRPPKPKSLQSQKKPVATPTAQRNRKPESRETSSRGQRRERREAESKRDRPELITLTDSISVHDLAEALTVPETEVIRALFYKGIAANINQILDIPTATMVAEEFSILVETAEAEAEAKKITEMLDASDLDQLQRRPPVVTIMGHVDHGKTTLLDSIRETKVAQGEAGGITQHIGAYHVNVEHGDAVQQVVFLDTPGHEAFTAMRARGARVTDIAILVVAADDGVRPQTIEAISHAKAAEVPIVVAINKVDKEEAQPERVKQELTEYGLVPEEWGGETIMVPVSAINGDNLDTLLEMILLVAEVEDLYANPDRPARGTVIEANLDKARGPVATLLVQNGTLRIGDSLVAGSAFGKVRAMIDDRGKRVNQAHPSFAVEVLGLNDVPAAGDEFEIFVEEKEARSVASTRADQQRQSRLQQAMASRRVSLNSLSAQAQEGELKELNLVLKADVQGSLEAILSSLQQLPQKEVQVRVLFAAPGEITETDVDLAAASNAVIVGFNTTLATGARQAADRAGVDVRDYNIIYKLLEDIQGAMEGLLEPEMVEEPLGEVQVRAVFPVNKGSVAGCYVQSGKVVRNCKVRVRRGDSVVYEGTLDSLKRVKDDVKEVNAGYECGIRIDRFNDWQENDQIEAFRLVSKRRTLSA